MVVSCINRTFRRLLLIKLVLILNVVASEEILGCGGFIKSHADIDFSKVEVKLLTKQGSLKDTTDCSPSNGYYFLPVYDKGDYILKISPPPGWSFEPEQINIAFDGKTDACSLGKDVNFVFKGFGITGRVEVLGQNNGAKGVKVELTSSQDKEDVRSTISGQNGVFYFTPVIPGTYTIRVSKETWHFAKSEQIVVVKTGNTELPKESFVVTGFDVQSNIQMDGHSLASIGVALFPLKGAKTVSSCSSENLPQIKSGNAQFEDAPICFVESQKNGNYIFNGVSSGRYLLKPLVLNKNVRLHIQPEFLEIDVQKESIVVRNSFEVTGFSVAGRVLAAANSFGIANAAINLNGKEVTRTHTDGSYTLTNVKSGTYTIQVVADLLKFNDQVVKVSLAEPVLPDIIVAAFQVCGTVVSQQSYIVALTKHSSTFHTQATTAAGTGEWCTFLPSGRFTVQVLTTAEEKEQGVQFFPLQQNIEVSSSPLSGVMFSQLRATITGSIKCLKDPDTTCMDIDVTLLSLDLNGKQTGQRLTAQLNDDGKYSFVDVLPGLYEVTVPNLYLSWETDTRSINVKTAQESVDPFVHSGYLVSVISSHPTKMKLTLFGQTPAVVEEIALTAGLNTFCAKKFGQYKVEFVGCHTYDDRDLPNVINIADHVPITVNAIKHRTGVRIVSPLQTPFKLHIEGKDIAETVSLKAESSKVNGLFAYRYDFDLKPEEKVTLLPLSSVMLFQPERAEIIGAHDCVDIAYSFNANQGLIVNGKILPAIAGAAIKLGFPNDQNLAPLETTSDEQGFFKFGPLDTKLTIEITAEKESYVFSDYDHTTQSFKAHKLCEIIATIKDEQGNRLPGVLLSLSGSESYRKNLVTTEDGTIKFHSLSPSQYYLRPMMKEYKFEPNSKIIDVKDGETINVELNGKRVAYSVLGVVRTLNGDPFSNAIVETNAEEPCTHHQEESATEPNGKYRIRGLQPGCEYTIRVKPTTDNNGAIERTIPLLQRINVEQDDVVDANFVAITPIAFVDVTARIYASHNDYYKSLRVQLYKKGSSDTPIYSQRVESPLNVKGRVNPSIMVFFPRIPYDGKTYFVELTTSLSDKNYKYKLPVQSFVSNRSSVFVELEFEPEVRSTENELNQNSISALLLIALIAVAFFKQELAFELFNFLWNRLIGAVEQALSKSPKAKKDIRSDVTFDESEIDKLAKSINATKKKTVRKSN